MPRLLLFLLLVPTLSPRSLALQVDLPMPTGLPIGYFGSSVTVLPNGNIVVTASQYSEETGPRAIGAAFLFSPSGRMISKITGTEEFSYVGSGGVRVLANGNYVICSPFWRYGYNYAGAVTWGDKDHGVSGVISASNSLIGTGYNDRIGERSGEDEGGVYALKNGNYVVCSPSWNDNAGAVTWGNGTTGSKGIVSYSNSMIGATSGARVGNEMIELTNGNYAFSGLATKNSSGVYTGSITWASGTTGRSGVISESNSLMGEYENEGVGNSGSSKIGVVPLANGNYVVLTRFWNGGRGAVTWANGATGFSGRISATNSLIGSTPGDNVGSVNENGDNSNYGNVMALTNGHYVVTAPGWQTNGVIGLGAIVWGNGNSGIVGEISSMNAVVGASKLDKLGSGGIVAIQNGKYVVSSPTFQNGSSNVGAVTMFDGNGPATGPLPIENSLLCDLSFGEAGGRVFALANGNYAVENPLWTDPVSGKNGAVTWCDGNGTGAGMITAENSLIGTRLYRTPTRIQPLANGSYVVTTQGWHSGDNIIRGAVTWCDGGRPTVGVVSPEISLVGSTAGDLNGATVTPLTNGHYVVSAPLWDRGSLTDAGAVTWGDGTQGASGIISPSNSLIGTTAYDAVGATRVTPTVDGNYMVRSDDHMNGTGVTRGASTLGKGNGGTIGPVTPDNSVLGTRSPFFGEGRKEAYDVDRMCMIAGRPLNDRITVFSYGMKTGTIVNPDDGTVLIRLSAEAGKNYRMQRSHDLASWPDQWQAEVNLLGYAFFRDQMSPTGSAFYRLKSD